MKKTLWNMMSVFVMLGILVFQPLPIKGGSDVLRSEQGINYATTEVTTVSASQATYAQEGFPDTPTGSSQRNMYVGYDSWYNKKRTRIFVKFDLPDLGQVNIISAKLQLGQYACEASSSYDVTAYRVTDSWGESTLTWNNQPGKAESVGNATFSTGDGTKEINITELVKQWYSGTYSNKGVTIRRNTESSAGGIFCSRSGTSDQCQGQIHPRLRIEYQASADSTMPTGLITSPQNQQKFGPNDSIVFSANASDNPGGSGVKQVQFWVRYASPYSGNWYQAGIDTASPYSVNWSRPSDLRSQIMEVGIHVEDNAGNYCIDPNPSGNYTCNSTQSKRTFIYLESKDNSSIKENWIPKDLRFYLNQRSLTDGDKKCGAASGAMLLAMRGKIASDYNTLASTANDIYAKKSCSTATCYVKELNNRGANVEEREYHWDQKDAGWSVIKTEINAGRPVILLSAKFTDAGHYVVVVGYREQGTSRKIIVYDPYGRWQQVTGKFDKNSTAQDSFKGQWAYYDIDKIWPTWFLDRKHTYLIITKSTNLASDEISLEILEDEPSSPPDIISTELEDITDDYEGEPAYPSEIYLPLVMK